MPTLMERQLDPAAGYLLQKAVEARGIKVHHQGQHQGDRRQRQGRGRRACRRHASSRRPWSSWRSASGPNVGAGQGGRARRSIAASSSTTACAPPIPTIFALGECAELGGHVYGLVAPLYEMARVAAASLAGDDDRALRPLRHADQAQGHRHRPLLARRLRRRRRPRGDRAARRLGRHLQARRAARTTASSARCCSARPATAPGSSTSRRSGPTSRRCATR